MSTNYFRFNLDHSGNYICGELEHISEGFLKIKSPEVHLKTPATQLEIAPTDNVLFLSTKDVVCYFRTEKS